MNVDQLLSDVKILDLSHYIAGPYCAKVLADYGADVIKIEKPGVGDGARRLGPFAGNVPDHEKSGLFLHLNTNKRGITLNLKNATGKKIFMELVKWADILVESFSPRVMPELGLDYRTLARMNPKLVMTSLSNFGQTGPYRHFKASNIILDGMGNSMNARGETGREPIKLADNVALYQSGLTAAVATMTALLSQRRQGAGQHVDVSIMETQLAGIAFRAVLLVGHAYNPTEVSVMSSGIYGFPFGNYPCKDGYFSISGTAASGFWPRVVAMMGMPELLNDPRFCTPQAQRVPENHQAFLKIFLPWCMAHTKAEITRLGQTNRDLVAPIYKSNELVEDPHLKVRNFFVEVDHPAAGTARYPGPLFGSQAGFKMRRPAPTLGQYNEEVYGSLGYSKDDLVRLSEMGVI
jgi:crotonobetainyl-CoA:carnitine CoA-transferase CaiB-like acyl-CoA transferase